MRKFITAALILFASLQGFADAPTQVTISAEAVGFPSGTICEVELRAEYRIIDPPRSGTQNHGKYEAITDAMATFVAPAAEQHAWNFVISETGDKRPKKTFAFTLPSKLPTPHDRSYASVYIPVKYKLSIPGVAGIVEVEQTYPVRIVPSTGAALSRCVRIEMMAERRALRHSILPDCSKTFEDLNSISIPQQNERRP